MKAAEAWQKVMAACYRVDGVKSHLSSHCLHTGISSGPRTR